MPVDIPSYGFRQRLNTVEAASSFPSAPLTGERVFRSDRHIEYFYDGTRWLSAQRYFAVIPTSRAVNPSTATAVARHEVGHPGGGYDIWLERFDVTARVTVANGSWKIELFDSADASLTSVTATWTGANTAQALGTTPNVVVPTTTLMMYATLTELVDGASLYAQMGIHYRLIG